MFRIILLFIVLLLFGLLNWFQIHFNHLGILSTFLSESSGAALGGFIGSMIVWFGREIYVRQVRRPKHVVTYYTADNPENIYGKLIHSGRTQMIKKKSKIQELIGRQISQEVIDNGIISYNVTEADKDKDKMAFHGPYRFDLTEPGTYEATFYYFGRNFSPDYGGGNPMLFHFDILLKENVDHHIRHFGNSGEEIDSEKRENTGYQKVITKGKKHLYYKDFLKNADESPFGRSSKMRFFYSGIGEFEFRAYIPIDPTAAFMDTVHALEQSQIYFFKVVITRIYDVEIPEAI